MKKSSSLTIRICFRILVFIFPLILILERPDFSAEGSFPHIRMYPVKEQPPSPYDCGYQDGPGLSAKFCNPYDIATDGKNLYVTDSYNHLIRKIVLVSAVVTTLAGSAGNFGSGDGTGTGASFWVPRGIAVDGKRGVLYVADSGNHTIRKIKMESGAVTTIAGSPGRFGQADGPGGSSRFNEPSGLAIDSEGNFLYVADSANNAIRRIDLSAGEVATFAGRAGHLGFDDGPKERATFDHPAGITIGHAGTALYVSEPTNQAIRKIEIPSGQVSTVTDERGTSDQREKNGIGWRLKIPLGLVLDRSDSRIYTADSAGHSIRSLDLATGEVLIFAGDAGPSPSFGIPQGLVFDPSGQFLLFTDKATNSIRALNPATRSVTTFAGPLFPPPGKSP